jgi:hypothetical protein
MLGLANSAGLGHVYAEYDILEKSKHFLLEKSRYVWQQLQGKNSPVHCGCD